MTAFPRKGWNEDIRPSTGQMKLLKVAAKRIGRINYQIKIPKRGPKKGCEQTTRTFLLNMLLRSGIVFDNDP